MPALAVYASRLQFYEKDSKLQRPALKKAVYREHAHSRPRPIGYVFCILLLYPSIICASHLQKCELQEPLSRGIALKRLGA